jgi:Fructose-bisphosphate aldolase class-II
VLHGSSGVPDDLLQQAVHAGIVNVNIGTALNLAFTAAVRELLSTEGGVVDPRRYLGPVRGSDGSRRHGILARRGHPETGTLRRVTVSSDRHPQEGTSAQLSRRQFTS